MTQNPKLPSETPPEDELQILEPEEPSVEKKTITVGQIWHKVLHLGLGESTVRVGTAVASIILVALVIWVMSKFFLKAEKNNTAPATPIELVATDSVLPVSESFDPLLASSINVIRLAQLHTILPPKPRVEIVEYTVAKGDTVFGIAEQFGISPESLFWSNKHILGSNADNLYPGITILIPPVEGVIHQWYPDDGLNGVANGFKVTPDVIVDWPGNHLDRATLGDFSFPNITPGTFIFVPNGQGEYEDWLPDFTRETAAIASTMGPGSCGAILDGPFGNGTFVWPTTETYLSGYDYTSIHHGIDIFGAIGNPVYSVDAGVVVYSGENNNGYGNLVIVDHGSGWQSVYAHLNYIDKGCGAYVEQGEQIGELGNTGNSTGPHLHFELRNSNYGTVNPWDFLP